MELTLINTNLNKYTFKSKKIKNWVEQNCGNNVLNLFVGDTLLDVNEIRNDVDTDRVAMYHKDAMILYVNGMIINLIQLY